MPSGVDGTANTRQSLPGDVSGGSGGEIQHENAGNGVATRSSEAQPHAWPFPQDSTEGMPDREDDKAAPVSTSLDQHWRLHVGQGHLCRESVNLR